MVLFVLKFLVSNFRNYTLILHKEEMLLFWVFNALIQRIILYLVQFKLFPMCISCIQNHLSKRLYVKNTWKWEDFLLHPRGSLVTLRNGWPRLETPALPPSLVRVHDCLEGISGVGESVGSCERSLRQTLSLMAPYLLCLFFFPEDFFLLWPNFF